MSRAGEDRPGPARFVDRAAERTQPMPTVLRRTVQHAGPTVPLRPVAPRPAVTKPRTIGPLSPRLSLSPVGGARWYRPALALWALLLQNILYDNGGYSWHYFADAAALFVGQHPPGDALPGGLHLYANYPQFQFGPLTLLVATALGPFNVSGGWMVIAYTMTLCGLAVLFLLDFLVRLVRPDTDAAPRAKLVTMLAGGGSFITSWELLAVHFGHLDDVLALLLLAAAAVMVAGQDAALAGLCVGLAVDAKPWALACVCLVLGLPGRERWRALLVAAGSIAVAWLPFALADPHTLGAAASFTIPNVPASALRALGVHTAATPSWDRIAQISMGCALGAVAVLRRRWAAAIALGIGARLALDPSVYTYYTAGLALGVLLWDLTGYTRPLPLLSLLCLAGLTLAVFVVKDTHLLGELRLWTVLVTSAVMLAAPPVRTRPSG